MGERHDNAEDKGDVGMKLTINLSKQAYDDCMSEGEHYPHLDCLLCSTQAGNILKTWQNMM